MIAVSIVTYRTPIEELNTCLGCLNLCRSITSVEIVDNSRSDEIRRFIETNYPDVIYTANDNVGYGAANNISIRKSLESDSDHAPRFHLVMNSDIVFMPDVIDTLVTKLDNDASIGLIMPAVVGGDGRPQSCCHPLPTPLDLILHRFAPVSMFRNRRRRYELLPQRIGHDINVPYMHGCFMLFRLDALRETGVFDERFFMYPEDIDITRRVHRRYKTIVTPDATICHLHRAESRHNMRMLWIHAVNMLRYFAKWGVVFDRERVIFNRRLRKELIGR